MAGPMEFDNDGYTMTATNHDELYPTMLNELSCTSGVSFSHVFTRDSIYAIARICHATSVCLSHACIVSKRLNVSSKFFNRLIGPTF